ncbi:hypothetical protein CL633_02985 [bacterium]|nr:hypothetical protein [bacterium]|tara:strand:- start:2439 stop:2741 length:303 start_codon:yes stop_codon:yes gene_type:complete
MAAKHAIRQKQTFTQKALEGERLINKHQRWESFLNVVFKCLNISICLVFLIIFGLVIAVLMRTMWVGAWDDLRGWLVEIMKYLAGGAGVFFITEIIKRSK